MRKRLLRGVVVGIVLLLCFYLMKVAVDSLLFMRREIEYQRRLSDRWHIYEMQRLASQIQSAESIQDALATLDVPVTVKLDDDEVADVFAMPHSMERGVVVVASHDRAGTYESVWVVRQARTGNEILSIDVLALERNALYYSLESEGHEIQPLPLSIDEATVKRFMQGYLDLFKGSNPQS